MYKAINFIEKTIKTGRVESIAGGKLSSNKDTKRYIPRKCTISIPIYNCDHATHLYTQKMPEKIGEKIRKSQEKINHLMYMDNIKLFAKNEQRIGNFKTCSKNIQFGQSDGN